MNTMLSNPQTQQIRPINVVDLVGTFKAIAPRSFEKTFDGIETPQIVQAMKICIDGLSREQVTQGLNYLRDNGFCPDPAMFRKWCLGHTGFGTEQQRIQESFKGKHAALANIIRWKNKSSTEITNAEKLAYDACYEMFNQINHSSNADRATYLAYEAFKDNYTAIISELAEKGEKQTIWNVKAIEDAESKTESTDQPPKPEHNPTACPAHLMAQIKGVNKQGVVV